jgi:hypothetical protein
MNIPGLSSSVRIAQTACYWKFFLVHYIQVLCQSRLCKADHAYLTYLMLQRQLSHLNGRKLDHRQVQASYKHVHSHDFVWLLLVTYINRGPVCTLENFQWCEELCFVSAAILRGRCLPLIPRRGNHKSLLSWSVSYGGLVYCWPLNVHFNKGYILVNVLKAIVSAVLGSSLYILGADPWENSFHRYNPAILLLLLAYSLPLERVYPSRCLAIDVWFHNNGYSS